ncbi:MAG TPA: Gfo/Idh/MocA family oxidoreductase [Candidatus Krumholzibacteria bacterium]|nr:Gfo/Idh/MocA family oxidoreductase [Candidatus Krumholzibacteria bacterium]HRX50170.1 Gfo/Idh/MocA family oxidoreductase [Candidatus Krumholzibacteria bacterium]
MSHRIAILGAGVHGARYAKHVSEDVPGLELAAVCRRDAAAAADLAARWGCRAATDAHALLEDAGVDAVIIATPPSSHAPLALAALRAGRPVLLEKPMAGTLEEARALQAAAAAPGAPPLFLAQTLRWNPVLRRVQELWPSLGRVRYVRASQRLEPTALAWQQDPARTVGGSILLTGVHLIDTVRFLSGREFMQVDCRAERHANPAVEDFFHAAARLDDGAHVSLEVSKFGRFRGCLLEAVGDEGQVWAEYYRGGIRINRGAEVTEEDVSAAAPTLPAVLAVWRDVLDGAAPPPVDVAEGLRNQAVIHACYASVRTGGPVAVPA